MNYTCNAGMADGAARICELVLENKNTPPPVHKKVREIYEKLTTRDPDRYWDSGQWMTEKTGILRLHVEMFLHWTLTG